MTHLRCLQESIDQYQDQLSQVKLALSTTAEGTDRDNLLSLQSNIQELISLTEESLKNAKGGKTDENSLSGEEDNPMANEYDGLKDSEDSEQTKRNNNRETGINIEDELKALEGMKCRAPHASSWGGTGYHNAMVSSVHRNENNHITTINDIMVRVLFVNPTHRKMVPCPYYLDGACKFSHEQCHYSHGELVPLSNLQEYREPTFTKLQMGSRVLAKQENNLWHRCIILKLPEKENEEFRIKSESSGHVVESALHDLLPLEDADLQMMDSSDGSESEREANENKKEALINRSLLTFNTGEPFGNWEQHTRGIGSKLMAQMGYVYGTGLGKRADGRIAPVEAIVLPAGKSLDHCMELREHAAGGKDLFSAEQKMRKQRVKMEQQREKLYIREKKTREESNVFNFINSTLGNKQANENEPCSLKNRSHFKTRSNRSLNVESFQISKNIIRLEKESTKLMDSLGRYSRGSLLYNNIVMQHNEKQTELASLRSTQNHITTEQNRRKDETKLSVF